ncbi:neprilysin-2-like, partial [Dermacentor silvarum]|uniref:neprilysin-2-like n=1 Tax=Dermacentor silvarum TaxID=543639 RepID=UPI0018989E0B
EKDDSNERFLTSWLTALRLEARRLLRDQREPIFDGAMANVLYIVPQNMLVFPAGVLRPTLFYSNGPASHNYGGLGQIAGSELMRGFDVKGMAYDDEGEKRPWGTTAQRVQLSSNALCLSKSFLELVGDEAPKSRFNAAVEPDFDLLADFAGLHAAYAAFQELPRDVRLVSLPHTPLDPDQAFFVSHCEKWCESADPPGSHQRGKIRCLAPLANMPAFSKAFNCGAASRMNRSRKCVLW